MPSPRPAADRALERALVANFVLHLCALAATALILLRALPGGPVVVDADRIAFIAAHPWWFRLGWLPWQLCAAADLWLGIALVRVSWVPRLPAVIALFATAVAVVPDQCAQVLWVTQGVWLAGDDPVEYLELERALFVMTAGWGALLYTCAAVAWTACLAGRAWSRALTFVSAVLWPLMAAVALAPLLLRVVDVQRVPPALGLANGAAFALLQLWLALATERVLRRRRPDEAWGRLAPWRSPVRGALGRALEVVANSRLASELLEPLPELPMRSDIQDVVYVNYLVPADRAAALVPAGLELQRLGVDGKWALFSFLTYRHGHFGFSLLSPLRRWLAPSPVQTNWRIHVRDPATGQIGIYFLTNAITSTPLALAARLTTEGMPMHVLARGVLDKGADGALRVALDPGGGSAPDAEMELRSAPPPTLSGAWQECLGDFHGLLAYCVPQDRAMASQPLKGRVSRQEIALGIPLDACVPVDGTVRSRLAEAIVGDDAARSPICFHVAHVAFRFAAEAHDYRTGRNQ